MEHNKQPPIVFSRRAALLGLVAYIVVIAIVVAVFKLG
jgi:hypothetical protein